MRLLQVSLGIFILQLVVLDCHGDAARHRHRHRHRFRNRVHNASQPIQQPNFETVHEEMSIIDTYKLEIGAPLDSQYSLHAKDLDERPSICHGPKSIIIKTQIAESIRKTLKFYSSHMEVLPPASDNSIGLAFLKAVDDKHGQPFQASYPISEWMAQICNATLGDEIESCTKITERWSRHKTHSWKSDKVLLTIKPELKLVGTEKEYLWGKLNGECQTALVSRCQVPYICERTLYDPVPRSMYFLTHQLFQRILTEQSPCESTKLLLDEKINERLCAKMYQEARLISQLNYPFVLRDVFAEYVGFCGYMGYPNFFREDWLTAILSWQSRSEYGCFKDDNYKGEFVTSDIPIVRRKTFDELRENCVAKEERCLPHFTTVSFSALAMAWSYMEDSCK